MSSPVLVVDDDADLREAIEEVLLEAGYEVLSASNGRHALEVLKSAERVPGLVLLDMMMPVMDGATFARTLRGLNEWRDLPVLVFSASANSTEVAEQIGAVAHLRKPVDVNTLLEAVKKHHRS